MISLVFALDRGVRVDTAGEIRFLEHTGFSPEKITQRLRILEEKGLFDHCNGNVCPEIRISGTIVGYAYGHELPNLAIDLHSIAEIRSDGEVTFECIGENV